ncbi:isonitrile hydratase [Echria macrotheca]|uniref:Isonitrile hydratase n=1 Tax=Echria macrotheca TaxID=438768 RepID=A0AAJ0B687_9PEZI|nr:isonitrile hydratase [Echria macrotheca]
MARLFTFPLLALWTCLSMSTALTPDQIANGNRNMTVGYILYPGFTILDVFGPLQFLNDLSYTFPITLSLIATSLSPVTSRPPNHHLPDGSTMDMSHAFDLHLLPTHTFTTAPPLDILIVPGGAGDLSLIEHADRSIESFIASRFNSTSYILSVCSGAGFLARAGVLDGRRATATKSVWAGIVKYGPKTEWVASARWVRDGDGKVWTSSGVTAGMDMMVAFLREVYGEEKVNGVVNGAEYVPHTDSRWDPFSVLFKVPGADMNMSLTETVGPLPSFPEE